MKIKKNSSRRMVIFPIIFLGAFLYFMGNALAKNYYVKHDGNDNKSGLSDEEAWRSISKVMMARLEVGDNIYFKCNDIFDDNYLIVDWDGDVNNSVRIGAYYTQNDVEIIGVKGNKPILDGLNKIPENVNHAMVLVNSGSYVIIENLRIINSKASGVRANYSDHITVRNVDVDWIRASGIIFYKSNDALVEYSTAHNVGRGRFDFGDSDWGYGIGGTQNCSRITIRYCKVYDCWSEGIGLYKVADNSLIESNILYNIEKGAIYIDGGVDNIIRYNLIYGTTDSRFHRSPGFVFTGIAITDEGWVSVRSSRNKIHGNFISFCRYGIRIGLNHDFEDSAIYNNTLVDNGTAISLYFNTGSFSNSYIRNNIFWQPSGGPLHDVDRATLGLIWSHNNWGAHPGTYVSGAGDVIGDPKLRKITGWRSLYGGDLNLSDFALQPGSPAIDAGISLGEEYKALQDVDKSAWPNDLRLLDQGTNGAGWEIGGDIHVTDPDSLALNAPRNVRIK